MSARVGVVAFQENEDEIPFAPDALPSAYVHGSPCPRGHTDSRGRTVRYAKSSGSCVACERENRAKTRGVEIEPMDVDTLVALALAKERRARDEERRKRERGNGLHKIRPTKSARGKSGTPATAMRDTGVECAREGCGQTLTRIAVANHSRYCSRRCAGLLAPSERGRSSDDVSDAELAEVAS